MLAVMGVTFTATLLIGVPIAFCLGLAALAAMLVWGKVSLILIPQRMFTGVDSFVLMAVPFFMLAGELMGTSGILSRLLRFADLIVGGVRAGSPRLTSCPRWSSPVCPARRSPMLRRSDRR